VNFSSCVREKRLRCATLPDPGWPAHSPAAHDFHPLADRPAARLLPDGPPQFQQIPIKPGSVLTAMALLAGLAARFGGPLPIIGEIAGAVLPVDLISKTDGRIRSHCNGHQRCRVVFTIVVRIPAEL
jgi:hypothetical protein